MLKKIITLISIVISICVLVGCSATVKDAELEELKLLYFLNMPNPDSSLSSYYIETDISYENYEDKEVYKKIDDIQKWLDNIENSEIIGIVPDIENNHIIGLNFMLRVSNREHSYNIGVCSGTYNVQGYVASVKVPMTDKNWIILIYDTKIEKGNSEIKNSNFNEDVKLLESDESIER